MENVPGLKCINRTLSYRYPFHVSGSMDGQSRSYVIFPPYIGNGKMCIASISDMSSISGYIKEKGYLQW